MNYPEDEKNMPNESETENVENENKETENKTPETDADTLENTSSGENESAPEQSAENVFINDYTDKTEAANKAPDGAKPPKKSKKNGSNVPTSVFIVLLVCALLFVGVLGFGIVKIATLKIAQITGSDATSTNEITETDNVKNPTEGGIVTTEEPTSSEPAVTAAPNPSLDGVEILPESTKSSDTTTTATNLISKCYDSVVEITIYHGDTVASAGSGVIYTQNGHIITNYHVARYIESANPDSELKLVVKLADGSKYEAAYVCGDMDTDIAVIKINKNDCKYAVIGNSDNTVIGEEVWVIGNPGGDGQSFTFGHISAIGRNSSFSGSGNVTISLTGLFLTDAAVNGGNSGGGLFNAKGELIGIVNGKKFSDKSGNTVEGMGFAIPISKAIDCINTLVQNNGYIPGRAKLGVTVYTAGTTLRVGYYNTVTYYTSVLSVTENTAAAKAGILAGDIIVALGGVNLKDFANSNNLYNDYDALHMLLLGYKVGDKTTISVLRAQQTTGSQTSYTTVDLEIEFVDFNYSK